MESARGKSVSKGEEDHAEAFTAGESYEVAGFSFSRVSQETGHLDREEKGSGATNANGFDCVIFFLIAGCVGSLGYWQSLAKRESKKQHQWYCIPKESQVPIHSDLRHHNLCMTERMVHKRGKKHNKTRSTKAGKHQPTTKTVDLYR